MIGRSEWRGLVTGRRTSGRDAPVLTIPLQQSPRGTSGTFLAADSDGDQWWVKPLNNAQGQRVTVTESIVGAVGRLISAPVCQTTVIEIPVELDGWEFRPGHQLKPGLAHASLAVGSVVEDRRLKYRDDDDNQTHHVGVFALYDWCWGGDPQWLYASAEENRLFSHDHGWYLPDVGPNWSEESLISHVDEPHMPSWSTIGLDRGEVMRVANRLRNLTKDELRDSLCTIPNTWPVSDSELECIGWFLEYRSQPVADRLENTIGRQL